MHTATQPKPSSFQYLIGGENTDLTGLFPRWTPNDRFGILIDRPLGALGASLLIQAAIAAFYDVRPGCVQAADVVFRSLERRVEENAGLTLNPLAGAQQVLALGVEELAGIRVGFDRPEGTSRWVERVRAGAGEVPE
ncbi:hypothetical protein ACIGHB_03105 [Streptomyces sp. NPDC085460]|uniref:hypothetical protein n=1 Tax=Streptomyces sp. NPDC085460 TaxID=3365723 RepID=UPI0037D6AB2C